MTPYLQQARRNRRTDVNAGVTLRHTHPNLYRALTTHACCTMALGLNFLFLTPAFNPLGVPKMPTGFVFCGVSIAKLVTLNMHGDLRRLRLATACSVALMFTWGVLQTLAYFQLKMTSLQSPILYFGLALVEYWLLTEPFTNPVTQKTNGNGNGQ